MRTLGRFSNNFSKLREQGKKAFVPFLVIGDPDLDKSEKIIKKLIDSGVDALELGIAFSDPISDGPTVQAADYRALKSGVNTLKAFELIAKIRQYNSEIPIGLLVYYNLVFSIGLSEFCKLSKESGVDAILAADVPVEEINDLRKACKAEGLDTVLLVSLNTSEDRVEKIVKKASGFLYLVSVLGVTGARKELNEYTINFVKRIRSQTTLPLLVGFGISSPEQFKAVCDAGADGAIVGSALIKILEENLAEEAKIYSELNLFVNPFKIDKF